MAGSEKLTYMERMYIRRTEMANSLRSGAYKKNRMYGTMTGLALVTLCGGIYLYTISRIKPDYLDKDPDFNVVPPLAEEDKVNAPRLR